MFEGKYTVNDKTGCWEWNKKYKYYPKINFNGKITRVHRASYIFYNGNIPEGYGVLHKCDNTQCINPNHLFLGTQADNMRDMNTKNRGNYSKNEKHKLSLSLSNRIYTDEDRKQAKTLRESGLSYLKIGNIIGCFPAQARSLCIKPLSCEVSRG